MLGFDREIVNAVMGRMDRIAAGIERLAATLEDGLNVNLVVFKEEEDEEDEDESPQTMMFTGDAEGLRDGT